MNKTERKSWNANGSKDTIANLVVLVAGLLAVIAGVVDVPVQTAQQAMHVAYQHTTMVR